MKRTVDYSSLRGFNYTQSDAGNDRDFWENYHHDIVERDMGYAERLRLNCVRIFLPYMVYKKDPDKFLADVKDFIGTAWKHGVATNPIVYFGAFFFPFEEEFEKVEGETLRPLRKTIRTPESWKAGEEYFDRLLGAIGEEPGLLFWDISNEPGYTDEFVTWYDEEPKFVQDFRPAVPDMKELREKQEKTWEFIRHFCKYVKSKDPDHDIGVGNIFIWETEPSRTAELVDVIVFHDYSATRARLRQVLEMALELGKKYNKPVVDNEMCCIGRANPYDMAIELHEEYHVGWFLFELMIGEDGWNRVHGVVYPDGTVRDPSIAAAILGFYRNRKETAIRSDVEQENYVERAIFYADKALRGTRRNARRDHSGDAMELLEACEFAANLLEGGELVPMAYPPTAKIEAYRRMAHPDCDEIRDFLIDLIETLKKGAHYTEKRNERMEELRI
ncbi:MAG: hypothetical protein IJL78_10955 [Lachnospiraceae bacterium]|nr:hypothetical protein [Lachnospiraceae bacterium]